MAKRRMFSLNIIDTDVFIEMPQSSRLLYYELCMRADDDGFVSSPKKIQKMVGCNEDDFKILITKQFILPFDTGIIVIKHWKLHNYIQKDRYNASIYNEEKSMLKQDENGVYTKCIQDGYNMDTQVRLGKDSIDKDRLDIDKNLSKESKSKYGEYKHVLLTDKELQSLKSDYINYLDLINYLDEYIEMKGYKAKSHYLCIKKWVVDAVKKNFKNNSKNKDIEVWLNE